MPPGTSGKKISEFSVFSFILLPAGRALNAAALKEKGKSLTLAARAPAPGGS
jgi:hypothetical protein